MSGSTKVKRMNHSSGANSVCESGLRGPHPISPLCRTRPMISSSPKEDGKGFEKSVAEQSDHPVKKRQKTDFVEHSQIAPDLSPALGTLSNHFKAEKSPEQTRSLVSSGNAPASHNHADQKAAYRITYLNQRSVPLPEGNPLPMHPILPQVTVPRHQQSTVHQYESSEMLFLP